MTRSRIPAWLRNGTRAPRTSTPLARENLIAQRIVRRQRFIVHPLDKVLAAFILTFVVSTLNTPDPSFSVKWILYIMILIGAYLLVRLAITNERQMTGVVYFLILGGAANSFISFFTPTVGSRVGSLVLSNPNALGNFLALILPLAAALALRDGIPLRTRTLWAVASLLMGASIILTLSRSSWVGMVVGLTAVAAEKSRAKYFALIFLLLGSVLFFQPVRKRLFEDRNDPGVVYRQIKIRMAWGMFRANPFIGQGPGAFQALAPRAEEWMVAEHSALENLYLQILAEGGLLQAAVFVGVIVVFTRTALAFLRTAGTGFLQTAVLGSLAACWAALGIGVGENPLFFPKINWLVGMHLGIIITAGEIAPQLSRPATASDPNRTMPPPVTARGAAQRPWTLNRTRGAPL